jgi:hypothetical protein
MVVPWLLIYHLGVYSTSMSDLSIVARLTVAYTATTVRRKKLRVAVEAFFFNSSIKFPFSGKCSLICLDLPFQSLNICAVISTLPFGALI